MRALARSRYGPPDVLEVKNVERPSPASDEVLVEVHASSLNKADLFDLAPPLPIRLIGGFGIRAPKSERLGRDFAGRVEAVGSDVKQVHTGDEVYGVGHGALAEFVCASEDRVAPKPANLSFAEAAALPVAGLTALQGLRKASVHAGQSVLIDGASGGVGTFAVQIAKSLGAEVTAVCSTGNMEMARNLGAVRVIDYTHEDFTKGEDRYDLILGVNGYHSILGYRRALTPSGAYLMVGSHRVISELVQMIVLGRALSRRGGKKLGFLGIAKVNTKELASLSALVEEAKVKPFVERTYQLAEAAQAFRYLGEGHARGKLVVTVDR